jgi:predicted dehydrogenase
MLRIGIVGCGKIADSHAAQIQRIRGCKLVAVCDAEPIMAQQLAERFGGCASYSDLDQFLDDARPDVVHIATPPQSHVAIGIRCVEHGAHILVEKPFTLDTATARALLEAAAHAGRKVTVGHDGQFSPVARDLRRLVQQGYLGGPPVHMESYWCYDLSDPTYAKALLADRHHWARQLPGGLPHNIISHGVSKIAEFLESDAPKVVAHGFVSPFLRSLGATDMIDELRVIVSEERGTTAYFTFSTQMRPSLHLFSIFGNRNGITIDEDKRTLIKLNGTTLKSYAEHFVQPMRAAGQYSGNSIRNVRRFLKHEFHMDDGKYRLFSAFYNSVANDTPVPIPYREIILTSRIMDEIFAQTSPGRNTATAAAPVTA